MPVKRQITANRRILSAFIKNINEKTIIEKNIEEHHKSLFLKNLLTLIQSGMLITPDNKYKTISNPTKSSLCSLWITKKANKAPGIPFAAALKN